MKEELYLYYKNQTNGKYLILDYFKGFYYFFIVFNVLLPVIMIILIFSTKSPIFQIGFFLLFWLVVRFEMYVINIKIKRFLNKKYDIISTDKSWENTFEKYRKKLIAKYLKSNGFLKIDKLEILILAYQKDIETVKIKLPLIPSILGILIIPLWSSFIGWIYRQGNITTINDAITILISYSLVIIFLTFILKIINDFINSFWDDWVNIEFQRIKNLTRILQDVKIDLELK